MNNIESDEFVEVMDNIGKEYAQLAENKKLGLMYSGGIDSTAMLLSLVHSKAKITMIHVRDIKPSTSYGIFRERMTSHLSRKYDLPMLILSSSEPGPGQAAAFYQAISSLGFRHLITGDGMDRMYTLYNNPDGSTTLRGHGEPFRAKHPFVEMFTTYMPSRLATYGKAYTHEVGDKYYLQDKKDAQAGDVTLFSYAYHPLMLKLFERYKEDVGDIFFRKRFTEFYVKERLGMSYNNLVRMVYRLNKSRMEPTMKRFFAYVEKQKKEPENGLEKKQ